MSLPVDPYTFSNATTADAAQVNARFAQLYAALAAGGLDPTVFAASALGSREVGLDVVGVDLASTGQNLTSTLTDVSGSSFTVTPTTASKLLIVSRIGLAVSGSAGLGGSSLVLDGTATIGGSIVGVDDPGVIVYGTSIALGILSLSAAAHTIKLQVNVTGGGTGAVNGRTQIAGLLVAA